MKIKYLAHASFQISSQDNKNIITDPYSVGRGINYGAIQESADIVTVSHQHGDHNNAKSIKGNPTIIQEAGTRTAKGVEIKSIPVYHDGTQGTQRGNNLIFCLKIDGLNICHAGDLGHPLSPQQISEIGKPDVLLIPVGGFYTINAQEASEVVLSLKPKMVIPMHYKTPKAEYPISTVDDFLKGKKNVRRSNSSEIELNKNTLPQETEIVVLMPSL